MTGPHGGCWERGWGGGGDIFQGGEGAEFLLKKTN